MERMNFVPRGHELVPLPGDTYRTGQAARRIGARWDAEQRRYVVTGQPYPVRVTDLERATALKRLARRGQILPADAQTARACGLRYQPIAFDAERGWAPTNSKE